MVDPGWRSVWRHIWLELLVPLPQFAMWRMARKGVDSLTGMRGVFLTWLETPLLTTFIVWIVFRGSSASGSIEPESFASGVCIFGLITLGLIRYFGSRSLDLTDSTKLAMSYRASFLLRMALAQAVFLIGFVGSFLTGYWWMVLVGVPFSLLGFALAAPTAARLAQAQEQIRARGSSLDLVQVLVSSPFKLGREAS